MGRIVKSSLIAIAFLALMGVAARSPLAQSGPPPGKSSEAWYTEDQAIRGKAQFLRNCGVCHSAAPLVPRDALPATGVGFWVGEGRTVRELGRNYVSKYPSVYHMYRRVRDSMPPWNPESVSLEAKVDIMAFLLKANGFSAGSVPLPADVRAMKTMTLNEPEFTKIFNGRDFAGIGFVTGMNCKPAPLGCGSTEPGSTFWVDPVKRELVTSGRPTGYWYPEGKYLNFDLRFDFRFERPADLDLDDDYFDGNTGYLLFITQHQVWPKMIEVQGNNINLLGVGGAGGKSTLDQDARARVQRPVGQWNSIRIVNADRTIKNYLNGALISTLTEHSYTEPGYIGFQSEGAEVHWRNIRIKAE